MVEDDALDAGTLMAAMRPWLEDPAALAAAGTHAAAFGRRDASTLVAAALHQLVEPRVTGPGLVTDIGHPGTAELPAIDDDAFEAAFESNSAADDRVGTALMAAIDANDAEDAEDARAAEYAELAALAEEDDDGAAPTTDVRDDAGRDRRSDGDRGPTANTGPRAAVDDDDAVSRRRATSAVTADEDGDA